MLSLSVKNRINAASLNEFSLSFFTFGHPSLRRNLLILGDPGASNRDDAIFSGERHFWRESLFQGLKSPWALFLTKRVPEVSKSVPLIGEKNIFLADQRGDLVG